MMFYYEVCAIDIGDCERSVQITNKIYLLVKAHDVGEAEELAINFLEKSAQVRIVSVIERSRLLGDE